MVLNPSELDCQLSLVQAMAVKVYKLNLENYTYFYYVEIFIVSGERKREAAAPSMPVLPSKKAKLEGTAASKVDDSWEQTAIDCDPSDLVASIGRAMENEDRAKARGLFCGGLKLLRKGKSDKILWLALMLVAKQWPHVRIF